MVKTPPKPPAVVPPTVWPTQQKVTDLADRLDRLDPQYEAMEKSLEKLAAANNDWSRKRIIQEAQEVIENFEKRGGRSGITERLGKLWDACKPDSWWPDDSDSPVFGEVAKMIAVLMGSFPTSKIPEPEIFVRVLLDDVMALAPSFVEMESTCRQLRQTQKFMPSVSEVIETLREQQELWDRRCGTAYWIEVYYNDLCAEIAKEKAAEDRKAAKSQPIVVGDRVRNRKAGAGTVTAVDPLDWGYVRYRVQFDAGTKHTVYGIGLERLIAGDEGFEPAAVPMIEHRKDVPMAPIASAAVALDANGDKVGVPADRSRETRDGDGD